MNLRPSGYEPDDPPIKSNTYAAVRQKFDKVRQRFTDSTKVRLSSRESLQNQLLTETFPRNIITFVFCPYILRALPLLRLPE